MQMVFLAGNVGKDAELRQAGGEDVLNFSLAIDNGKDKNGNKRDATWWDCAIWGKRASALKDYIKKGGKLSVQGRPTVRVHDGKAYLGYTVSELTFQGSAGTGQQRHDDEPSGPRNAAGGYGGAGAAGAGRSDFDDDIPF